MTTAQIRNCERRAGAKPHGLLWRDAVTGARRFAYFATDGERDAGRQALAAQLATAEPEASEPRRGVVRWLGAVAQYLTRPGIRTSTRREAERILTDFATVCGITYIGQVTAAAAERFFAARRAGQPLLQDRAGRTRPRRQPSEATLRKEQRTLAGFFAWARRAGLTAAENPFLASPTTDCSEPK